ncbi:MAG TPA: hypothetical protein VF174_09160 [Micromonosporaceae bacterium]
MSMQVRVQGGRQLGTLRETLRGMADGDRVNRQMTRAFRRAAEPLKPAIQRSAVQLLPKRGGYGELMSKSVRVRTAVRGRSGSASVTITVFADGRKERRDVARVNKGVLRHPVYGRTRPLKNHARYKATSKTNPWVEQRVRRGFVDRPIDRLAPEVRREMHAVVDWIADQITKG